MAEEYFFKNKIGGVVDELSDDEDDDMIPETQPQKFSEHTRLEFYDISELKSPKIACVMMVKNEKKRLHVSLESVTSTVCCYIMFDTGSEDNTKEIIIEHCKKHEKNLYMITGNFVDFSISRNCLLDYADTIPVDFLVLLDTNDELRNGDKLLEHVKNEIDTETNVYLMCQEWWCGFVYDKYWNNRFIRNNKGWRYNYPVHEILMHDIEGYNPPKLPDEIVLFQDRTLDDDKTSKRFYKDKAYLRREYLNNKDERIVYYLAQTYSCLSDDKHAYRFHRERYNMEGGFYEERFRSALKLGELSEKLGFGWEVAHYWYLKSHEICERAEPMIAITEYYDKQKIWSLAYLYCKKACELPFPEHCSLSVDKRCYEYYRFSKMGIIAWYYGKYEQGKKGCLEALKIHPDSELDKDNLKFYTNREEKLSEEKKKKIEVAKEEKKKNITKQEYFRLRQQQLRIEQPNLRQKSILSKIRMEWKMKNLKI